MKIIVEKVKGTMAGCFPDFRQRTTSFDLHNIGNQQKMSLLHKLFRSKSDSGLKISPNNSPKNSPRTSPKGSPGSNPRRRYVRVVRNNQSEGEEYVNPHVIRKYNRGFIETTYMKKSQSLDDGDKPLPYTVTGNTILKKHHSIEEDECLGQSESNGNTLNKHTSFNEDVEIVEFDRKGKCLTILDDAHIVHEKLQDDPFSDECLADGQVYKDMTSEEVKEEKDEDSEAKEAESAKTDSEVDHTMKTDESMESITKGSPKNLKVKAELISACKDDSSAAKKSKLMKQDSYESDSESDTSTQDKLAKDFLYSNCDSRNSITTHMLQAES